MRQIRLARWGSRVVSTPNEASLTIQSATSSWLVYLDAASVSLTRTCAASVVLYYGVGMTMVF